MSKLTLKTEMPTSEPAIEIDVRAKSGILPRPAVAAVQAHVEAGPIYGDACFALVEVGAGTGRR